MKIRQLKVHIFQEDIFEGIRSVVECLRCMSVVRAKMRYLVKVLDSIFDDKIK